MKRCPQCGEEKSLTLDHWTPRKRDNATGEILAFAGWCRDCSRAKARERRANRTPEQLEAERLYQREVYEWEKRDPNIAEKRKAARRRYRRSAKGRATQRKNAMKYYYAMKADPEKYAAYLENKRIKYHLRRLDQRGDRTFRKVTAIRGYRGSLDVAPVEQVAELVDEVIRLERAIGWLGVEKRTGMAERSLRRYVDGESRYMQFEVADRLSLAFGIPLSTLDAEFKALQLWLKEEAVAA